MKKLLLLVAALLFATPVFAQSTYNTPSGVRVPGSVLLTCDSLGVNCAPSLSGLVTQPYATAASRWTYAAATGGITNTTTAVTVKAAAGAGLRNYITDVQISADALGVATEIVIRDGAAGPVLWRGKVQTAGVAGVQSVDLGVPLVGTANTLLEVATLTASVTGGVYVNVQGFTGP